MALVHEQLQNTAIKVIHSRITDVLLNTVYEITNLKDEYADTEIYGEILAYTDLSEEIEKICALFKKLPENLAKQLEDRTPYNDEIAEYRNGLVEKYKSVLAYSEFADILAGESGFRSKLEMIQESADILPQNDGELVDTVSAAVARSYDIPFVISSILSKIPLRMAKSKYEDFVSRSLDLLFSDISNAYIENYKYSLSVALDPQHSGAYGKYFTLIAQSLDELSKFNYSNAKGEELEEQASLVDDISDKLGNLEEILNVCYNISNYLEILNTYALDEKYACNDDAVTKDMLHSCIEMLDSDDPDFYIETIIERTTDQIEKLFNDARDYEDTLQDTVHRLTEAQKMALPEDCRLSINVYNAVTSLYMLELSDAVTDINKGNIKPATIDETNAAIKDVIKMINDSCTALTPTQQKLVKQRLFTHFPADISPNEFREYMLYALEGIQDKATRLVVYGDVLEVLDDMHLIEYGEDEHEHHHHHHDHDCDCGHEHDHEHEHHHH